MKTMTETMRRLAEVMIQLIHDMVPENQKCRQQALYFETTGFRDDVAMHARKAGLRIVQDLTGDTASRRLMAFVLFPGTDKQMFHQISKGTNAEITEYLSRPETPEELKCHFMDLDQSMWKHN